MSSREVVIIPATIESYGKDFRTKKLRVASYCRVSTDSDEQLNSVESQKTYYTNYIKNNKNWKFVDTYADEGISGASAKKRPAFMKMISHCTKGKIDLIVTKSLSRFSRNILDSIGYIRKLKALNIGIYFEKENLNSLEEGSELIFTILAGIAQEELLSLSKNVKMGKRMAMKEGKVNIQYKHLFAYIKGEDGKPKIIEEQADIIKRIFTTYLMGESTCEIAKKLNEDKVKSPKNTEWKAGTIRNIIKNEFYCGDLILQKTYILDPISKKVKVNNGELPKVHIKNNHIGIISREMYNVTQFERSKRSSTSKMRLKNTLELSKYSCKHALNNMLICNDCKSEYRRAVWTKRDGTRQAVWRCSSRLDYGTRYCTNSITLDEISLKEAVINSINSTRGDRKKLIDILADELGQTMRDLSNMEKVNILELQAKVEQLTAETMKIVSDTNNIGKMHLYAEDLKAKSNEIKKLNEIILKQREDKVGQKIEEKISDIKNIIEEEENINIWNDGIIRQLIKLIEVVDETTIHIIYTNGYEHDQKIELKVRKLYKKVS